MFPRFQSKTLTFPVPIHEVSRPVQPGWRPYSNEHFLQGMPSERAGGFQRGTFTTRHAQMQEGVEASTLATRRQAVAAHEVSKRILLRAGQRCREQQAQNHEKALAVVRKYCGPNDPEAVLAKAVDMLRNAPLRTHFRLASFSDASIAASNGHYRNGFTPGADPVALARRDEVENDLFDLNSIYAADPSGRMAEFRRHDEGRIRAFFKKILHGGNDIGRPNPDFVPDTRPKYAAAVVDRNLILSVYGKCFAELDPVLKSNATYHPRDTFNDPRRDAVCTFDYLENLIAHGEHPTRPGFVKELVEAAVSGKFRPGSGDADYIDVQIHGPVPLSLVRTAHLSRTEINRQFPSRETRDQFLQELDRVNHDLGRQYFVIDQP